MEYEIEILSQEAIEENLSEQPSSAQNETIDSDGFAIYSASGFAIYSASGFAIYSASGFAIY